MAYATVTDLEARWRTLSATEKTRAGVLLGDAQVRLDAECSPADPPTEAQLASRKIVSCEMVKRAMIASGEGDSGDLSGVSSIMGTAGPFSQQRSFQNPMGDLYITKSDRKLLGCGKQKAFMIDTAPPGSGVLPWTESTL
ncbi:Gp19/Gp15/Gp42 family protein [Leucobacter japonicus]|uniref:Gp19/Gp15/Gp42 family protein n=1 Tax=Leucobacter japonicus TaxID=1461259 RepID=UPI0006A7646A|nr:Gp19/Gp15/Gp42 family protein [Leucobacter japonicus]